MAVEHINETDTLNQGRIKINAILDQSNASSTKVDGYEDDLAKGITEAKQIATDAGQEAVDIATAAGQQANVTANEAKGIAQNANTKSDNAVATANQNKQEFDQLRNEFDDLVSEAGNSNPEIVQARTDTSGIKQSTLANRLTVDFADRMTNADAIELISGQTIVKKMMDFSGKTAGNTSTNPHAYYSDYTANTLKKPTATWNEVSQSDYNKLASRDDSGVSTGSTAAGIIPQQLAKLDVVATVKALSPQLFDKLSSQDQVQFVRDNFVSFATTVRGKATSPNNKNLKVAIYMPATDSWSTVIQQDATEYTDFTSQINDNQYITDDGLIYLIYYSDSSNGVTSANIDIDYVGTAVSVTLNAQNILASSGFAKTEDVVGKDSVYTKVESDEKFSNKTDLSDHLGDKSNPHNVTVAQVGGITPSAVDIKVAAATEEMSSEIKTIASDMINEIIRRSPQVLELTVADQIITNGAGEATALGGLKNQANTDPTRFLSDGSKIYISKAGTYTFDLSCSINNKGAGTYFGFQIKQSNGDQSFPGPALRSWAGDKAPVIISGTTTFEAGDQLTIYTYPANAKYEINNLRIRLTYWGDDSQ